MVGALSRGALQTGLECALMMQSSTWLAGARAALSTAPPRQGAAAAGNPPVTRQQDPADRLARQQQRGEARIVHSPLFKAAAAQPMVAPAYADIGSRDRACAACGAKLWPGEVKGDGTGGMLCCTHAKACNVSSLFPHPPPALLARLMTADPAQDREAREFQANVRKYNTLLQLSSSGIKLSNPQRGLTMLAIKGGIFHQMPALRPSPGQVEQYAQMYIIDSEDEQLARRLAVLDLQQGIAGAGVAAAAAPHEAAAQAAQQAPPPPPLPEEAPLYPMRVTVPAQPHPHTSDRPMPEMVFVVESEEQMHAVTYELCSRYGGLPDVWDVQRLAPAAAPAPPPAPAPPAARQPPAAPARAAAGRATRSGINATTLLGLQRMLHVHNRYVQQYKQVCQLSPAEVPQYDLVLLASGTPDKRRYNLPSANEVAGVMPGGLVVAVCVCVEGGRGQGAIVCGAVAVPAAVAHLL